MSTNDSPVIDELVHTRSQLRRQMDGDLTKLHSLLGGNGPNPSDFTRLLLALQGHFNESDNGEYAPALDNIDERVVNVLVHLDTIIPKLSELQLTLSSLVTSSLGMTAVLDKTKDA